MCGCFAILLGSAFPRVTIFLLWIFTDWVNRAFDGSWLFPFLGLLVLPYTTLIYILVSYWSNGVVSGFGWAFVALGFFFDISAYAAAGQNRRLASQSG